MSEIEIVNCERERPGLRQFCHLNSANDAGEWKQVVSRSIPATISRLDKTIDIEFAFRKLGCEVGNADGTKTFVPSFGLAPYTEIVINWTDLPECRGVDSFWDHEIRIYGFDPMRGNFRVDLGERVDFGQTTYKLDLNEVSPPDNRLWSISRNEDTLDFSSGICLKDEDFVPSTRGLPGPFPNQRIPTQCKMIVLSVKLVFDAEIMSLDLANLKLHALRADELLIKTSVLHGHLVDGQNGSVCQVSRLAQTLISVEGLSSEELENLSFSSKKAIQQAVSAAVTAGGIPESEIPERATGGGLDYWGYFKTHHQELSQRCATVSRDAYVVSTAPFVDGSGAVINRQGFQNATDYQRVKENLTQYVVAAWAIAEAAGSELASQLETEWLNRGFITVHLG